MTQMAQIVAPQQPLPARPLSMRLKLAAADIKLAHSVFAMPFALLGAFLARRAESGWPAFMGQLALVASCMFLARTWAMFINRLADARFDAANPRTARRAIASGALPARDGRLIAVVCAGLFILAAGGFWFFFSNPWPLALAAPVLAWLALYSYAKRFTSTSHLLLGSALALSPLASALAVRPESLVHIPALYWLAGMVTLWVAGFDVIYALQDVDFDRSTRLFSIPSRLGVPVAMWLSRAMHAVAALCLLMAWSSDQRFGPMFLGAVVLATCLLVFEHLHLARRGQAGLEVAFFAVNGIVSCLIGLLGILDVLL